ncbi:hypothetical protein SCA6_020267 [Theobroma cacao]
MWESFNHRSNTLVQNAKLRTDIRPGEKLRITSWKSPSDPSDGNFSAGIDPLNIPEAFIWNNNRPYWRSGPWNGQVFIGVPQIYSVYLDGFSLIDDKQGSIYITFAFANLSLSYILLDSQGNLALRVWDDKQGDWVTFWSLPETECDVYGQCGAFGSCDSLKPSICSCLRGFEPKIIEEWNRGNWTSGCVRSKPLQCERVNNSSELGKDGFLKLGMMKVPDFAQWSRAGSEYECKEFCLRNCSCIAYAYDVGIGCMSWSGKLIDIQKFPRGGKDLYIRVAHSELDKKTIIIIALTVGTSIIPICVFFSWKRMPKLRVAHRSLTTGFISARKEKGGEQLWFSRGKAHPNFVSDNVHGDNINQANLQELPLFNFEELATATNNFHPTNKLGQGGFGPVYRVWKLWNEDNILALLHTGLYDPCYQREIVKCIHAGLLCVQEFAEDRPTISTVISMLNSEIVDLPAPKQPAYTGRLIASGARSPQNNLNHCSINKVTLTTVEGR